MSTTLGGMGLSAIGLPHTLGYIIGGMLVGPSCLNLISMVTEVETFAQFGSIFLLFGHGLMYSTFLRKGVGNEYGDQDRMGAFTVLFVVFSALLLCASFMGIDGLMENIFLSAAATLSSTAMVSEFLVHNGLSDTVFAHMVIDLVSIQDIVMCPLLAIPTAILQMVQEWEGVELVVRVLGCALLLLGFIVLSRRLLPPIMHLLFRKDKEKELSSGLFSLGVFSYCLGGALLCERLNLSHEAGALLAGLLMMDSPLAKNAYGCMQPLTSLFGGMYLGSMGMIANPAFIIRYFGDIFSCVCMLISIKVAIVTLVMQSFGFTLKASTLAGACMAQVSEISLFFVAQAHNLHLISRHHYLMTVAASIIIMVVSPFVLGTFLRVHSNPGEGSGKGGGAGSKGEEFYSAHRQVIEFSPMGGQPRRLSAEDIPVLTTPRRSRRPARLNTGNRVGERGISEVLHGSVKSRVASLSPNNIRRNWMA
ncbi:unnamed protein product [Discosporangium mesarthrocarpum]